ncbi:hypothetical protein [Desulfofundulus kuznetsovii]|uniref:hypothetical protein n=1 Tax=Desulfofundulus kuznetsovii TaxID=58135 RepID=UPI00059EAF8C
MPTPVQLVACFHLSYLPPAIFYAPCILLTAYSIVDILTLFPGVQQKNITRKGPAEVGGPFFDFSLAGFPELMENPFIQRVKSC